jgi:hypothetical protein
MKQPKYLQKRDICPCAAIVESGAGLRDRSG